MKQETVNLSNNKCKYWGLWEMFKLHTAFRAVDYSIPEQEDLSCQEQ